MSFNDIAARFKKHKEEEAKDEPVEKKVDFPEMYAIKGKIIGVLIRDARVARGYTVEHVAQMLHIAPEQVVAWEFGQETPGLAELELLAFALEIPVSHFVSGTETLISQMAKRNIPPEEYVQTRNRMVGVLIRLAREKAGFTVDYLAERTGTSPDMIAAYEYGQKTAPLYHLVAIGDTLHMNVSFFMESQNRVGRFLEARETFDTFMDMDPEVRHFIAKPSNHRYIELAMKLAEMEIDKMRSLAENILEITY